MIIALDGPSASGKGVIGRKIAEKLNFAYLDTGLLFRAVAYEMIKQHTKTDDKEKIITIARNIGILNLDDPALRYEAAGKIASIIAALPEVRTILNEYERHFGLHPPYPKKGAVLDGRDIGTIIFPDAECKIFITARVETRALRRHNQLLQAGQKSIYNEVLHDLVKRDERDQQRQIAPLVAAPDALHIDTTDLSIDQALEKIFSFIMKKRDYLEPKITRNAV